MKVEIISSSTYQKLCDSMDKVIWVTISLLQVTFSHIQSLVNKSQKVSISIEFYHP